jgi:tRNA(Ile)-lysidine synthase
LGLIPWDDPHNVDRSFQRARLRHEALPLLEEILQGGVAEALARTATLTQADMDALDALAEQCYPMMISAGTAGSRRDHHALDASALAAQPAAIRTRVLRRWTQEGGVGPLTATHLATLDALVTAWHGQHGVNLPGGYVVSRASGRLCLLPPPRE